MTSRAGRPGTGWLPYAVDLDGLDASPFEVKALGDVLTEVEADEGGPRDG